MMLWKFTLPELQERLNRPTEGPSFKSDKRTTSGSSAAMMPPLGGFEISLEATIA